VRDVTGNLLVNLVSIFVLGALLLGYKFTGELQQGVEKKSGLNSGAKNQSNAPAEPVRPDDVTQASK
jgi:hypothetical protein